MVGMEEVGMRVVMVAVNDRRSLWWLRMVAIIVPVMVAIIVVGMVEASHQGIQAIQAIERQQKFDIRERTLSMSSNTGGGQCTGKVVTNKLL